MVPEAAPEEEEVDEAKKTGISRCGFSWDDAAAKMGASCEAGGWEGQCTPPEGTVDDLTATGTGDMYAAQGSNPSLADWR